MKEELEDLTPEQLDKVRKDLEEKGIDKDQIDKLIKELKKRPVIKQTTDQCEHHLLKKVHDTSYQCMTCNMVVRFIEAEIFSVDGYLETTINTIKGLKGADKWKKKYLRGL
jgi:hypothetical protein